MTCHHREDFDAPLYEVGAPRRCRCQVRDAASVLAGHDHCHQEADAEDLICRWCRELCPPSMRTVNVEQVGLVCTHPDECWCPEPTRDRAAVHLDFGRPRP